MDFLVKNTLKSNRAKVKLSNALSSVSRHLLFKRSTSLVIIWPVCSKTAVKTLFTNCISFVKNLKQFYQSIF